MEEFVASLGFSMLCERLLASLVSCNTDDIAELARIISEEIEYSEDNTERIKEELRLGKGTLSAVKAGFGKAFWSIFDSNITTIIASLVLWYFGTGTVQGFAITLFIGVVVSMFTALVVTKLLMITVAKLGVKNPKLYGI